MKPFAPRLWALLVLVAAGLPACRQRAAAPAGGRAREPMPVQLATVAAVPLPTKVAVTGVLAAQEELVLGLEVAGRLETIVVDVGDAVAAGAVIAALAPREYELAVQRAEAALVAAKSRLGTVAGADPAAGDTAGERAAGLDLDGLPAVREAQAVVVEARLQRDRTATMVQQKMTPESAYDSAAAALAVAESRLLQARDQARTWLAEAELAQIELLQAQKRLADSVVRAPWAGRVAVRHATAGQVLASGAPIVTLLRIDPLRLRLRIPDRLASETAIGQTVEFTVDGRDGAVRTGTIVRAGPAIERGDRTRLLEAAIPNADSVLLPGGFCRAQIVTAAAAPTLVVPKLAVLSFAGVHRVFEVLVGPDGQVRAKGRVVEPGRDLGERIELRSGPAVGTRIVADATGLSPDQPVVVRE
ncbi:MAG: efflux RND transporter periplasmic adaptor subunit [Planctomycetes bacterium]|nr:efflux RND transporter periplasmic adaptor subunit [Planctomycetota bacterium]